MHSATLQRPVEITGRGLFSGTPCRILIEPSASPITFAVNGEKIAANPANFRDSPNCTVLGNGKGEVRVIEHLLAALWVAGIDHAVVQVEGGELPNQDGSALPLYAAVLTGGNQQLDRRPAMRNLPPVKVEDENGSIEWEYSEHLAVSYEFSHPELGQQQFSADPVTREFASRQILPARTFITEKEAMQARSAGILFNTNEEDALIIRGGMPGSSLRFADEYARHKVLDLLGDLYVLPFELTGRIRATYSGHKLNRELATKLHAASADEQSPAAD